ncbi:MAG: hypothetical protein KDK04_12990 [Candidatus Competibacteraceae bacterium]|nr:hypothetical protein [Candidatus Competibacteraceae bacterium]
MTTVTSSSSPTSPPIYPHLPKQGDAPAKAAGPTPDSALLRFFDAFLQERNIKWLLAIGSLILLSSSVMLVGSHWNDYAPVWQFMIMLGYCGLLYQAGLWSYYRLALRRTGTGLMALTLLLLPALFFALAWSQADNQLLTLALLALTSAFTLLASRRILLHFLHAPQPTFLSAYLSLSAAYAVLPWLSAPVQTLALLGLWLLVCAGTLKVSRHVFWLAEEQRAPRIFGFFPVALLGGLFVGLSALYAVDHIALEWLGLGCTLAAVPILLSADALHKVFVQRSGGLLNERPVAIMLPVFLGLIVALSGVVLTGAGFMPGHSLLAVSPTALLAAGLTFIVACRSRLSALIWFGLVLFTVGYNFAPAYFASAAMHWADAGASLLAESRLPYGFYGLSYLPLLLATSLGAIWAARRDLPLFSKPLQGFSALLSVLLLGLAYTHSKALLPVATLLTLVLVWQTWLFRSRWLGSMAIFALLSAALGFSALNQLNGWVGWIDSSTVLLLAAALLLLIAVPVDRYLAALPPPGGNRLVVMLASYLPDCARTSVALSVYLIGPMLLAGSGQITLAGWGLAGLLVLQAARLADWRLGAITLLYLHALLWLSLGLAMPTSLFNLLTPTVLILNAVLLAQWALGYVWRRYPQTRLSRAFKPSNDAIALLGLLVLLTVVHGSMLSMGLLAFTSMSLSSSLAGLLLAGLTGLWALDAARRFHLFSLTVLGFITLFATAGVLVLQLGIDARWLPLTWVVLALGLLATLPRASNLELPPGHLLWPARTLRHCAWGVLLLAVAVSLLVYQLPLWSAGAMASLGALSLALLRRQKVLGLGGALLLNAQLLALVLILSTPVPITTVLDLSQWLQLPDGRYATLLTLCALPLAAAAALSRLGWTLALRAPETTRQLAFRVWKHGLGILALSGLWLALALPQLGSVQILFVITAFAALTACALIMAYRHGQSAQVWLAEGLLVLAGVYLAWHGVITFGQGWSAWLLLLAAAASWLLSQATQEQGAWAVFSQPLRQTALALPALAVVMLLFRHATHVEASWLGRDSLALLLAAAAYAWYGYAQARRWAMLLALGLANLTLLSIWHELSWTDPQFYLIPVGISILSLRALFREQLPPRWRDPLNYLGALIILVSPLFNIVNGSWWHVFSLMLISLVVIFAAIGCRIRSLLYTGMAFLLADLVAMIVLGGLDNPSVLWLAGLLLGGAVIALAALAERGRENLVLRLQTVSAALAEWH